MLPKKADVVVIGGGVLGTSAAFQLADSGQKNIVLLDRGPIAGGTTPFAAGQTGYLKSDRRALEFCLYCIDFFENFEKRTGHPIDFRQHGSLRITLTDPYLPDLETRVEVAKTIGHDVQMLTPSQAKQLVPTLELEQVSGILRIPRDGYVEPKSVAVAYAAAAHDRGVTIATRTNVCGLEIADGSVKAVQTSKGAIETEWVVLAAGAWTRQFGQQLGLDLKAVPVRHQAFVTAPLPQVSCEQPIVRIVEPQLYVRHEAAGLMVGGYGFRPLSFDMRQFPDDFEIPALPADQVYYHQLAEAASQYFPVLRDAVVIQERRGLPTMAPDGHLIVSQSQQIQGLVIASACCVGGIHASPGVGRIVADIVLGREPWLPASALTVDRFADEFEDDARLRSQCETIYSEMYHEIL